MSLINAAYRGKRVLVTGSTGFKGSWLTLWLLRHGAIVRGLAHGQVSDVRLYDQAAISDSIVTDDVDVRDRNGVGAAVREFQPEIVFHLAAEAIVNRCYADPVMAFGVNTMGTAHVLESLRSVQSVRAVVVVTSDKCYRNNEWEFGYRETDALGGIDPYSASKAGSEIVLASYLGLFQADGGRIAAASARAGNVIGGGDFAADRIIPDCVRAWMKNESVELRKPHATRPWQHVLEPLSGYLALGAALLERKERVVGSSFNFGPESSHERTVLNVVDAMVASWPGKGYHIGAAPKHQEAGFLKLNIDRASSILAWRPVLDFHQTIAFTAEWYRKAAVSPDKSQIHALTLNQINQYEALAASAGLAWAVEQS